MDFDSSTKFISSLAKFLQSLCNGYVEFDSGVEVIGHIYLSVDTGKKIDYILNEKVCKTDENSVTFISNSFHAQPAEKPKPPPPKPIKNPEKEEKTLEDDDIILMDEPESTNTGTVPSRDNSNQNNVPQSNFGNSSGASKRPHNQHFPSNRASKHRRIDSPSVSNPNGAPLNSHESNDSSFNPNSEMSNVAAASDSDLSHLSQVLSGNNNSNTEERDVKPVLDSDMNVVNVKQEYDPSAEGQDSNNMYNEQQDDGSYYSGMDSQDQSYDMGSSQYYGGRRGTLQSEYGEIGSGEYPGGAGPGDSMMGDSQGQGAVGSSESLSRLYNYDASKSLWKLGEGCPVAGCNAKSLRFVAHFMSHWKEKHEDLVRKYRCPQCRLSTKRRAYLVKHCRVRHGMVSLPEPHYMYIQLEQNGQFHNPHPITLEAALGVTQK